MHLFVVFLIASVLCLKEMEEHVNVAMRGSPHEVLSEGFGLSLTRKDLQTLSNLNWLNDEVRKHYLVVHRTRTVM